MFPLRWEGAVLRLRDILQNDPYDFICGMLCVSDFIFAQLFNTISSSFCSIRNYAKDFGRASQDFEKTV